MGQRSPLVTLAATAIGLVALLVVNSTQTTTGSPPPAGDVTTAPITAAPTTTTPTNATATSPSRPRKTTGTPPTTPSQPVAAVYAGRTEGREATLAIAVKGGQAAAYLCDGSRVEAWLTGTRTANRLTLRSRAGDQLVGIVTPSTITGSTVTGTVAVRGQSLLFEISEADPPAGLYRARTKSRGAVATIGWIVLADGSQVGIDNDGTPGPAPPLDPLRGTAVVDGVPVTARAVAGDETF